MKSTNQAFQKNTNLALVLRQLWLNPLITRMQIAHELNLDKSTIVNIIKKLLEKQITIPVSKGKSPPQGGRMPLKFSLVDNYACVMGIEIQPAFFHCSVINLTGKILFSKNGSLDAVGSNFENTVHTILNELIKETQKIQIPLIGISIGIPGYINTNSGMIIKSKSLILENYPFGQTVANKYELPILIENDANCCAWGEILLNKNRKLSDFIYILAEFHDINLKAHIRRGIGIGLGIVINGKIYYGSSYGAGEFKSVFWDRTKSAQLGIPDEKLETIKEDNEILKTFINELFINLQFLNYALNPSHIIIGGDLRNYSGLINEVMNNSTQDFYTELNKNQCRIEFSHLAENDVAFGAAAMFLEKLFAIPELNEIETYYIIDWDSIFQLVSKQ